MAALARARVARLSACPSTTANSAAHARQLPPRRRLERSLGLTRATAKGDGASLGPGEASPPTPPSSTGSDLPPALAAKLAAAKAYKATRSAPATHPPPSPGVSGGSASTAAPFLAGAASAGLSPDLAADPTLRPEDLARLREAEERERGGEVITARPGAVIRRGVASSSDEDAAAAAAAAAGAPASAAQPSSETTSTTTSTTAPASADYKPKVSTWGVFERPKDISKAYGGGRTIRPGEPLETPEEAAARAARTAALLDAFKKKAGLDEVNMEEMAAAEAELATGLRQMKAGNLAGASEILGAAAARVPPRSRVGGLAALNKAICDDSLGRRDEAYAAYKRLAAHPTGEVAKRAKQMIFGFVAADNLKVSTMDLSGGVRSAYRRYFTMMESTYNLVPYLPEEGEDPEAEAAARVMGLVAVGVALAPVALFAGYLALKKVGAA